MELTQIPEKNWFPPPTGRLGATFFVRKAFPWLHHYFELPELGSTLSPGIGGIVSWGGRIPAKTAIGIAHLRSLPHWNLEDGFLRSVGLGKAGSIPLSIIADDLGLPVDAGHPSRLERLIEDPVLERNAASGKAIRERLVQHKLSKYNHLPHTPPKLERSTRRRILLVDQVVGDVSVGRALGNAASFEQMLRDAVASGGQCLVRTHPDVMAGYCKGYLTEPAARTPGVIFVDDPVSVASILDVVDEVWTVSSQFGLDALLRGLPVRCYAVPFYAGWGLTQDKASEAAKAAIAQRRKARPTLDELVEVIFSLYPSYRDPVTWQPLHVLQAIDLLVGELAAREQTDG
ncbi:capsular biosynthesis protein (plasmid) [Rhizobium sp. 32-5/1]|uniref:capsular polysaccharide export protein, LipB/KpsS family n=1 Tax=Rhizobium sp. 32-5/1 TaxID=3019602 RepID=UPI00240D3149|nr:capsular biosynthesis protein [Rhizobium sp. 32-5/1]WEZ85802.1 capsular biosynthesis protein [Rhizobium sp. 32-5/1]